MIQQNLMEPMPENWDDVAVCRAFQNTARTDWFSDPWNRVKEEPDQVSDDMLVPAPLTPPNVLAKGPVPIKDAEAYREVGESLGLKPKEVQAAIEGIMQIAAVQVKKVGSFKLADMFDLKLKKKNVRRNLAQRRLRKKQSQRQKP